MSLLSQIISTGLNHDQEYIITIQISDDALSVQAEEKITGFLWKNSFTCEKIEAITEEAGSFKRFDVFVRMMISAFHEESNYVFLDVLSPNDLQRLRPNKASSKNQIKDSSPEGSKRYMILTHVNDLQKFSFPLPMVIDDTQDPQEMIATIKRMRSKIEELKAAANHTGNKSAHFYNPSDSPANQEFMDDQHSHNLKSENEILKDKCRKLEDVLARSAMKNKSVGTLEFDLLLKSKLELENNLDDIKRDHAKEVQRYKAKIDSLAKELAEAEAQLRSNKCTECSSNQRGAPAEKKRGKVSQSEEDVAGLSMSKGFISHYQKMLDQLNQEIDTLKITDEKQKTRIKELEKAIVRAFRKTTKASSHANSKSQQSLNSPEEPTTPLKTPELTKQNSKSNKPSERARTYSLDKALESPKGLNSASSANLNRKNSNHVVLHAANSPFHDSQDKSRIVSTTATANKNLNFATNKSSLHRRKLINPLYIGIPEGHYESSSLKGIKEHTNKHEDGFSSLKSSLTFNSTKTSLLQSPLLKRSTVMGNRSSFSQIFSSKDKQKRFTSLVKTNNKDRLNESDNSIDADEFDQRMKNFY